MRTLAKAAVVTVFALAGSLAQAQVYKCKTSDGRLVYQQIQCSGKETGGKVKVWAQPKQADIVAAQSRLRAQDRAEFENTPQDGASVESQSEPESPTQVGIQARDVFAGRSGSCPNGEVALNASSFDPRRGWSKSSGYVPLRCGSANRQASSRTTRTGPGITEPKRIQDQHGNFYNQPPGSAFATDERTGKQCFVYGNFVDCK